MRASIVVLIAKDLWNEAARNVFPRPPRALVVSTKWLVYIRGTVARLQEAKYKIIGLFLFSSFAALSSSLPPLRPLSECIRRRLGPSESWLIWRCIISIPRRQAPLCTPASVRHFKALYHCRRKKGHRKLSNVNGIFNFLFLNIMRIFLIITNNNKKNVIFKDIVTLLYLSIYHCNVYSETLCDQSGHCKHWKN